MKALLLILLPVMLSGQTIEKQIDSIVRNALSESLMPVDMLLFKIDSVVRAVDRGELPMPPPVEQDANGFVWVDVNGNVLGRVGGDVTLSAAATIHTFGVSGPVSFELSGPISLTKNEGVAPYALFGDVGTRSIVREFPKGNYQLTASYSGGSMSASFEVK